MHAAIRVVGQSLRAHHDTKYTTGTGWQAGPAIDAVEEDPGGLGHRNAWLAVFKILLHKASFNTRVTVFFSSIFPAKHKTPRNTAHGVWYAGLERAEIQQSPNEERNSHFRISSFILKAFFSQVPSYALHAHDL